MLCHVYGSGFETADLLAIHLVAHPGRTDEEIAAGAAAREARAATNQVNWSSSLPSTMTIASPQIRSESETVSSNPFNTPYIGEDD